MWVCLIMVSRITREPLQYLRCMLDIMLLFSAVVLAVSQLLGAFADHSTTSGLLWPMPKKCDFGPDVYLLQPESFQFLASGAGADSDIVKYGFIRYSKMLFDTSIPFVPTGATQASDGVLPSLNVNVQSADESLGQDTNESCKLAGLRLCMMAVHSLQHRYANCWWRDWHPYCSNCVRSSKR